MVESGSLENCCPRKGTGGSNPPASANFSCKSLPSLTIMTQGPLDLNSPITSLPGVGSYYANKLYGLGIETVRDLLFYFPFRWDDFSQLISIAEVTIDQNITVKAELKSIKTKRTFRRRMTITEAAISDNSGSLKVIWFNQPFLEKTLHTGEVYRFSGKIKRSKTGVFLQSPSFEVAESSQTQTGALIPVYHVTSGLSPKTLRQFMRRVLPLTKNLRDYLPGQIIQKNRLLPIDEAIFNIHFPRNKALLSEARRRLSFDELFIVQLNYQSRKSRWQKMNALAIKKDIPFLKKMVSALPFRLTNDQRIALWEIIDDCSKDIPMNRLLEGDVGSGKTVVAALSCLNVAKQKRQAAFMAPTEILARQHFKEISLYARKFGINVALLTNNLMQVNNEGITRADFLSMLKRGGVDIVVGTHSLIQKDIRFKSLAFVVVDEQHRFGVKQRAHLIKEAVSISDGLKNSVPHLLSMTATPIPRTLALTIYGDLNISLISTLPQGRKEIVTKIIQPEKRFQVYNFINKEISKGRQAFVICPLIEESADSDSRAAEAEHQRLQHEIFKTKKVGLLHGKLKPQEKEAVMQQFIANKINILVSTSVVEVGIDVPNATVMVIEGSERFGLSQLHQFRGRVGRGEYQSFCFLLTDSPSPNTWKRMLLLEKTQDGFALAERDLKLRGPGEFMGERQSGFSNLVIASLNDTTLLKLAREEAVALIARDPDLNSVPALKKRISLFNRETHFE